MTLPYAVNLTLDDRTSDAIERVYAQLAGMNIRDHDLVTQYGPCVTLLVVGDRISPDAIARTVELRLPAFAALAVSFKEPCIIVGSPPTLSLRASPTEPLLALHNALYSEFAEDEVHLHYRPAYWQPHLKLSNVRDHAAAATLVATIASGWRPLDGTLSGLEVIQYPPTQSIWQARLKQARE